MTYKLIKNDEVERNVQSGCVLHLSGSLEERDAERERLRASCPVSICSGGSGCAGCSRTLKRCIMPTANRNSSCRASDSPIHTRRPIPNGVRYSRREFAFSMAAVGERMFVSPSRPPVGRLQWEVGVGVEAIRCRPDARVVQHVVHVYEDDRPLGQLVAIEFDILLEVVREDRDDGAEAEHLVDDRVGERERGAVAEARAPIAEHLSDLRLHPRLHLRVACHQVHQPTECRRRCFLARPHINEKAHLLLKSCNCVCVLLRRTRFVTVAASYRREFC